MANDEYLINFSEQEIEAIRAKVCDPTLEGKALTDIEFAGFIDLARRYGAHPLRGQMFPAKYWDKDRKRFDLSYQTTIDLMRTAAHRTNAFAGMDEFEHVYSDTGSVLASTTRVYRMVQGVRCPFPGKAIWDELVGSSKQMAGKMPITWIDKCAEASALRRAFPLECGTLYIREEHKAIERAIEGNDADPPPTSREVPQRPDKTTSMEVIAPAAATKQEPTPEPKPKAFSKADLVGMVGRWSGAHPDEHLEFAKRLIAAKGLSGVPPKDERFQAFCATVRDAMDTGVAFDDFAGTKKPEPAPAQSEEEITF